MQSADLVQAMAGDGAAPLAGVRVDGGAAANDLLMQPGRPARRAGAASTPARDHQPRRRPFGPRLGYGLWRRPQDATHWLDRRFGAELAG